VRSAVRALNVALPGSSRSVLFEAVLVRVIGELSALSDQQSAEEGFKLRAER